MKKRLFSFLLIICMLFSLTVQALAQTAVTPSGLSSESVEQASENTFSKAYERYGANSAVIYIVDDENAVFKTYGNANTIYRWGDMSSMLVWIAAMQLVEDGRISLDADIQAYLPKDTFRRLDYDASITMLHLMNGNAGWERISRIDDLVEANDMMTLGEYIREVEPKQMYAPGVARTESAYCTLVAAYVVECVSGMPYEDYMRENIFAPLSMTAGIVSPANQAGAQLPAYPSEVSPAYPVNGAYGTAADLCALLTDLLSSDASVLFTSPETAAALLSSSYSLHELMPGVSHGIPETSGATRTLALDVDCSGTYGGLRVLPDDNMALAVLVNTDEADSAISLATQLLRAFTGEQTLPIYAGELPKTAQLQGSFVAANMAQSGFMRLSEYTQGLCTIIVTPYTATSTAKVRVSMRMYSSQYVDNINNTVILYYEPIDQIAPYLFVDVYGNLLYFVEENGDYTRLSFAGTEYVKTNTTSLITLVDLTIYALYAAMLYGAVALVLIVIYGIRDRKRKWPSYAATKFHSALSLLLLILGINNYQLLFDAARHLSYAQCAPYLWINIIGGILALAATVGVFATWKHGELIRRQKIAYLVTAILALIMIVIIIAWQLYF